MLLRAVLSSIVALVQKQIDLGLQQTVAQEKSIGYDNIYMAESLS